MTMRDVFLCHASEDKAAVVRPLVSALKSAGITYWYDEAEIQWGDSITDRVNEGLRMSCYVLVVLSEASVKKPWPQRELNAALNIEASTGEIRVLPLVVGDPEQRKGILETFPILNDKLFLRWESDPAPVVDALRSRLGKAESGHAEVGEKQTTGTATIPMPQIRKQFSQQDKDRYLRESFQEVRAYFEEGARRLRTHDATLEMVIERIHERKFVCNIYQDGGIVNRCKIWIGGPLATDAISYLEGHHLDIDNDNSCNDWLTVEATRTELALRRSSMGLVYRAGGDFADLLNAREAAEYLWLRATERLANT